MTEDTKELIRLIGVSAYIRLVCEQHQLKIFLGLFFLLVIGGLL